jgi:hypothetical protein
MAVRNLTERVEVLEMKVGSLEELPARMSAVESQIVQLRSEMHGEFSAVRQEMRDLGGTLRQEMRALNEETKAQMLVLHEEVLDRISRTGEAGADLPRLAISTGAARVRHHRERRRRIPRLRHGNDKARAASDIEGAEEREREQPPRTPIQRLVRANVHGQHLKSGVP